MKEVIRIDDETNDKPIELTYFLDDGWEENLNEDLHIFDKIVYLGRCEVAGDMFATYKEGGIEIYKGHLNSGKY